MKALLQHKTIHQLFCLSDDSKVEAFDNTYTPLDKLGGQIIKLLYRATAIRERSIVQLNHGFLEDKDLDALRQLG